MAPSLIEDLRRQQHDALGRAATKDELAAAVERWIRDEMLVREARSRGLDIADPVIRGRLAIKMAELFDAREVPDTPDDAELRALYEAHLSDYRVAARLTVRQLFVTGPREDRAAHDAARARAVELRSRAEAGLELDALTAEADTPPGGPVLRGRRPARLVELYGAAFAEGLDAVALDTWHLRPSPMGWHIVRVERRQPGRQLTFQEAHNRVRARWQRERLALARDTATDALRATYTVEGWPPAESPGDE